MKSGTHYPSDGPAAAHRPQLSAELRERNERHARVARLLEAQRERHLRIDRAVDATIVRAVLLPSAMKLLGEWNWYLPKRPPWASPAGWSSRGEHRDIDDSRGGYAPRARPSRLGR